MINTQKNMPSVADTERAERLREIIEHLHDINERIPVIVEGKKDAAALRSLGLIGDVITLHNGKNLYDFCDDIARRFHRVVLLLDWDRKGEDSEQDPVSSSQRALGRVLFFQGTPQRCSAKKR